MIEGEIGGGDDIEVNVVSHYKNYMLQPTSERVNRITALSYHVLVVNTITTYYTNTITTYIVLSILHFF